MQITTLRKSGSLSGDELEFVKTLYSSWVRKGCPHSKEMSEVALPRLIETVEILKGRLEYGAQLEKQVAELKGQLKALRKEVETPRKPMKVITSSRPSIHDWQSVRELSQAMQLSTSYLHNMASGAAKNRYDVERRESKACRRMYDYRIRDMK